MLNLARGEEGAFFLEAAERLAETLAQMPSGLRRKAGRFEPGWRTD
jgi:hypothetical protein